MKKYLLPLVFALLVSCRGNSQGKKAQKKYIKSLKQMQNGNQAYPL